MAYTKKPSQRKPERRGDKGFTPRESFPATCGDCSKKTTVPFKPTTGKPVRCSECFGAQKERGFGKDSRGGSRDFKGGSRDYKGGSRDSRDSRDSRAPRAQAATVDTSKMEKKLERLEAVLIEIRTILSKSTSVTISEVKGEEKGSKVDPKLRSEIFKNAMKD